MWEHLWTEKPAPPEYIDLLLCERFGWTPDELYSSDSEMIEKFLIMWSVEQKVKKAKDSPTGRRDANIPT
jgi:hypothetical protein